MLSKLQTKVDFFFGAEHLNSPMNDSQSQPVTQNVPTDRDVQHHPTAAVGQAGPLGPLHPCLAGNCS